MIIPNYKRLVVALICFLVGISACNTQPQGETSKPSPMFVNVHTEYVHFSYDEMLRDADLIFVGKVLNISPTKWNQDSGEYWEVETEEGTNERGERLATRHSALPIHEIELSLIKPLVNETGTTDKSIVLTVLGKSPLAGQASNSDQNVVRVGGEPSHSLQIGDEIIVFAMYTELAWRNPEEPVRLITTSDGTSYFDIGKRSIISFIGIPGDSFLIKSEDGTYHRSPEASEPISPLTLDDLELQIAQYRGN